MNKAELLQDLASKPFVDSINGQSILKETKVDGGKWYVQNIREINPDGKSAVYRNIYFYVIDEGTKSERAYYKDAIPEAITKKAFTFTENVKEFTRDSIYQIDKTDEDLKFAIARNYIDDGTGNLIEKKVIITEANDLITEKEVVAQKETLTAKEV